MRNLLILFFLLFSIKTTFSQVDLTRGLIAYYPFNGNAKNAVFDGLHGIIHGDLQLTKDRFGNDNSSYLFNGINTDIIVPANNMMTTPAFSICYYFKTFLTNEQVITGKIEYENGLAATFNTGIFHADNSTFFSVLQSLNNCNLQVTSTYSFAIFSGPVIQENEWYCVVNTFENGIQKLYLNGVLVREERRAFADATLCPNTDFVIGSWWKEDPRWFNGVIDDVRYYNRAINEDEVKALCGLTSDSLIINQYAAVREMNICDNGVTLDDASPFNTGDTVLLIQMKGAVIDSSNTPSFGQITSYNNAGNYEFNIVKSKSDDRIILQNTLQRNYDFQNGKVQLVRVPYFSDFNFDKTLTAAPWDGNKGGILCFNASGTVTMNADIDVSGKGFRHGSGLQNSLVTSNAADYYYDAASNDGGEKGEGVAFISGSKKYGRGALANGGGGGNAHNAGGGGGGNGGAGGRGGDQYETLKTITEKVGGIGGYALDNNAALNRLFLGGAGGMGQANDLAEFPAGNGGGIVIISANKLVTNSHTIKANGDDATEAPDAGASKDGMPGGGGGGTILLDISDVPSNTMVAAAGGKGADQKSGSFNGRHGPGGGGGGGVIAVSQSTVPAAYVTNLSGGKNGVNSEYANDPWDAHPGADGILISNFKIVFAGIPFKKNIDSVRIKDSLYSCNLVDFQGLEFINTSPVKSWSWNFGDNTFGTSNPELNHHYTDEGNFTVTLVIADENGCKDSATKIIAAYSPQIEIIGDTSVCAGAQIKLFASGASSYHWSPAPGLDNPDIAEPIASPLVSTRYFVEALKAEGCTVTDSVDVIVNKLPVVAKSNDTTVCLGASVPLSVSGGTMYSWSPENSLNDLNISGPIASPSVSSIYYVKVTNEFGCYQDDSIKVSLFPVQQIQVIADPFICKNTTVLLSATGGNSFNWFPASLVENPSGQSTKTVPLSADTTFKLTIKDLNSCIYTDSIRINVWPDAVFQVSPDQQMCLNGQVKLTASGADHYTWSPAGLIDDPASAAVIASPDVTTTFSVIVSEDRCGEKDTLFTTVRVLPLPEVTATSSNDVSCLQPASQLLATGSGVLFSWSPESYINSTSIKNPIVNPKVNTVYVVKATDQNGCTNSDSVLVKADLTDKYFTGMPNAFTPNSDGLNDCFGVKSLGQIKDLDFRIYNRYGQLIFKTNNPTDCWDGRYKGELQDAGAYVYIVKGTTTCEIINLKGTVQIIR